MGTQGVDILCITSLFAYEYCVQLLIVCIEPFAVEFLATHSHRVLAYIAPFIAVSLCVIVCCSSVHVCWLFSCGVRGCEVGYCIIMMLSVCAEWAAKMRFNLSS